MCSVLEEVLSQRDAGAAHMRYAQCHNAPSSFIWLKFTAEHLKEGSENVEVRNSVRYTRRHIAGRPVSTKKGQNMFF